MPGTAVVIGLNSPASLVPGLRSKVSLWLGPPSIHSRMQDLCLTPDAAARAASTLSQPDIAAPPTPAADSFRKSRRDRPLMGFQGGHGFGSFHGIGRRLAATGGSARPRPLRVAAKRE